MADTNTRITNMPDSGSRERVAFDLMARIANEEHGYGKPPIPNPREYYLRLFDECRTAVGF